MNDNLPTLILRHLADGRADERAFVSAARRHIERLADPAERGDRNLVRAAEAELRRNPNAFSFDDRGVATLTSGGRSWSAGRFSSPSIGELRDAARARGGTGRVRLWVLDGASPATDVAAMQAFAGEHTLFQVASQFNCLEAPGPFVVPVSNYFDDPTQGPRAAISCFPAALLRHHAAPDGRGGRFEQSADGRQIDLLADAVGSGAVQHGYLDGRNIDGAVLERRLRENFDSIRIGLHEEAEVALGHAWFGGVRRDASDCGPIVTQVLTSTLAGGGYGGDRLGPRFAPCSRLLLRAAYLGTLLSAAAVGCRQVVLTLIGGGVFANPREAIAEAIVRAVDDVSELGCGIEVFVNGYSLDPDTAKTLTHAARRSGGLLVRMQHNVVMEIDH